MASLTILISVPQLLELVRPLSPEERRQLLDTLLAERFSAVLADADRQRSAQPDPSDDEIQSQIGAIRRQRREDRCAADR